MKAKTILPLLLLVLAVVFVPVAHAEVGSYSQIGTFAENPATEFEGGNGSEDGQLNLPGQADVNAATGDLYVADTGNDRVEVFRQTATGGEYDSQGSISEPTGLAIDQASGDVYVAGATGISKFDAALNPIGSPDWTDPGVTGTLAVDPSSGDLLIADQVANLIRRFESDGTAAGSFAAERPIDLAVDSSGEIFVITSTSDVTLDCSATSAVERFDAAGVSLGVVDPSLQAPGAVAVGDEDALLVASHVNGYNCGGYIQLSVLDSSGATRQTLELSGNTLYAMVPGLAAATLADGSSRVYAVTKSPAGDAYGNTKVVAFEAPPATAPTILSQAATPAYSEATLTATINPGNSKTTYRFEYGPTAAYGSSTPSGTIAAGGTDVSVSVPVRGLSPQSGYHFRVVTSNSQGGVAGPDHIFTTLAQPSPDTCPNAAIRQVQSTTGLADCRAYEQVSPVDKNGFDISTYEGTGLPFMINSSPSGDNVTFQATGAFAGAPASLLSTSYLGTRGAIGWGASVLTPPQSAPLSFNNTVAVMANSSDLSRSLVFSGRALAPGAVADQANFYIRDNATGAYSLVLTSGDKNLHGTRSPVYASSPDLGRIVLVTSSQLLPEAAPGVTNVYLWRAGSGLELVNILPDESVAPREAFVSSDRQQQVLRGSYGNPMSSDGSRIYFTVENEGGLDEIYVRVNGTETRPVSTVDPGIPMYAANFQFATADGSAAFFVGETNGGTVKSLYRYDFDSGGLTDLTPATDPEDAGDPKVEQVVGLTDDASYIYFTAGGKLAPDAIGPEGVGSYTNVYVLHDGAIRLVAPLRTKSPYVLEASGRTSPNGLHFAFESTGQPTGYDSFSSSCSLGFPAEPCPEVFVYDYPDETLDCASCPADGVKAAGAARFSLARPDETVPQFPRNVLDDGRVYFNTPQRLTPGDSNSVLDVYEYRDNKVNLISGGSGDQISVFGDSTPDGSDVFFLTRDRLVSQDDDSNVDLYDARVDGGLAGQNPQAPSAPCGGEACRGPASASPALQSIPSSSLQGPGNRKVQRQKKKGHKKKGKHKKAHANQKHRKRSAAHRGTKAHPSNRNHGGSK